MPEAGDYYDREALEQATEERSFDLVATGLLETLADTLTHAGCLVLRDEQDEPRPWERDDAVLAAQVVRCSKLLRAYAEHFHQRQLEICNYTRWSRIQVLPHGAWSARRVADTARRAVSVVSTPSA